MVLQHGEFVAERKVEIVEDEDENISNVIHPDIIKLETRSLYEQLQAHRDEKDKVFQQELKGIFGYVLYYVLPCL